MCLYGKAFLKCCLICLNSVCCLLNAGFLPPSNQTANREQKAALPWLEVFSFLCPTGQCKPGFCRNSSHFINQGLLFFSERINADGRWGSDGRRPGYGHKLTFQPTAQIVTVVPDKHPALFFFTPLADISTAGRIDNQLLYKSGYRNNLRLQRRSQSLFFPYTLQINALGGFM